MDFITYSERLDYLLDLIKKGRIDSPQIAAEKLDCSEKTIRNMINNLRNKGFDIEYCRNNKKYFLKN